MADENWMRMRLGDFVTFQRGHDLPTEQRRQGTVPILGSFGITGWHNEAKAPGPGVTIGRSGASFGVASYSPVDYWPLNTALFVIDFHGNDERFAYYFLKTFSFRGYNSGSAQPSLNRNLIHPVWVNVPPLSEQRAIAYILGTLDDKIELNRRMNETLDAIAQAIFKSWFVDFDPVQAKAEGRNSGLPKPLCDLFPNRFEHSDSGDIPVGWELKVLDDLIKAVLGGDWGGDMQTPDEPMAARCIRGADIPDLQAGGLGKMPLRYLKPSSLEKRQLTDGDLVVEISGGSPTQSTGRPLVVSNQLLRRLDAPLVCSNFCRLLKLKDPNFSRFAYLWLQTLYANDEFLQFENGTTGIKNLAFALFSSRYRLCIPSKAVLTAFDELTAILFDKKQAAASETDSLASIRDALLPKLISGEIRVKDAEKFLGKEV